MMTLAVTLQLTVISEEFCQFLQIWRNEMVLLVLVHLAGFVHGQISSRMCYLKLDHVRLNIACKKFHSMLYRRFIFLVLGSMCVFTISIRIDVCACKGWRL